MGDDDDVAFSRDQLLVVFNSDRDGVSDLYTSTRASTDEEWAPPTRIAELSSADADGPIALPGDGLSIMLAHDVRVLAMAMPTQVATLNSTTNDGPSWISNDRSQVVFHSSRLGPSQFLRR